MSRFSFPLLNDVKASFKRKEGLRPTPQLLLFSYISQHITYTIWNAKTQIKIIKLKWPLLVCEMLMLVWTCDYIYSYLLHNTRAHGVVFFFHHIQFSNPFYLFSLLLMIDKIKHVSRGNWMIFRLTIDFVHLNYQINRNITWWWVDLCVNTLRRITCRRVGNKS